MDSLNINPTRRAPLYSCWRIGRGAGLSFARAGSFGQIQYVDSLPRLLETNEKSVYSCGVTERPKLLLLDLGSPSIGSLLMPGALALVIGAA